MQYPNNSYNLWQKAGLSPNDCQKNDVYIKQANNCLSIYFKEIIKTTSLLSREDEIYFTKLAHQGSIYARNKIVDSNLRLVIKIARKYISSGISLEDLISEGNLGVIHAIKKFNPNLGYKFSTYSAWWIQQYIERAIMNQQKLIRLPVHVAKELQSFSKRKQKLTAAINREPSVQEVANALKIKTKTVNSLSQLNETLISVDNQVSNDCDVLFIDLLRYDNSNDPHTNSETIEAQQLLKQLLSQLPEQHQQVLIKRYGLFGNNEATLEEVSQELDLSREKVRTMQAKSIKILAKSISKLIPTNSSNT